MKKLNRKDIGRLLKINPENFLIVNTNYRNEIEVVGRLLKTSAGLALIIYKDRIIRWFKSEVAVTMVGPTGPLPNKRTVNSSLSVNSAPASKDRKSVV